MIVYVIAWADPGGLEMVALMDEAGAAADVARAVIRGNTDTTRSVVVLEYQVGLIPADYREVLELR